MNSEEKILQLLEEIKTEQTAMRTEQADMRTELSDMRTEQADIRTELSGMRAEQADMQTELSGMRAEQADIRTELSGMRAEQADMQTELSGIRAEQANMQTEQKSIRTMLTGIEERLAETQETAVRTAVLLEGEIQPKIQLLFDGHTSIIERLEALAPKTRVEALEDEVSLLKIVVKTLSQDVAELKKAQ